MNWKIKNHNGIGNVYESITGCLFPIARRPFILTGKTMALSTFGNFNPTYFSAIREGYLKNKFYQNLAAVKLTENKEDKFTQDFLTTFQKFVEKEVGDFFNSKRFHNTQIERLQNFYEQQQRNLKSEYDTFDSFMANFVAPKLKEYNKTKSPRTLNLLKEE